MSHSIEKVWRARVQATSAGMVGTVSELYQASE